MLPARAAEVLADLRRGRIDPQSVAGDSRPVHSRLFRELTPPGYEYYAGHYRGEEYRCLRYCRVGIPADPRVGYAPERVRGEMAALAELIKTGLAALDTARELPAVELSAEEKLLHTVVFACHIFEYVLCVHPYVDGNGHAARFIMWALLGRYGYWPTNWPLDPRPADPPYSELIMRYRDGEKVLLEAYVLRCVRGH